MIIFMSGTSCTGKTSTLNEFPNFINIESTNLKINCPVFKEYISATTPRKLMDNPTFSMLTKHGGVYEESFDADYHQHFILEYFSREFKKIFIKHKEICQEQPDTEPVFIVERSLNDVLGYAYAFQCLNLGYLENKVTDFFINMRLDHPDIAIYEMHFPINPEVPYDEENGRRPPIHIRDACQYYLNHLSSTEYAVKDEVSGYSIADNVDNIIEFLEKPLQIMNLIANHNGRLRNKSE